MNSREQLDYLIIYYELDKISDKTLTWIIVQNRFLKLLQISESENVFTFFVGFAQYFKILLFWEAWNILQVNCLEIAVFTFNLRKLEYKRIITDGATTILMSSLYSPSYPTRWTLQFKSKGHKLTKWGGFKQQVEMIYFFKVFCSELLVIGSELVV